MSEARRAARRRAALAALLPVTLMVAMAVGSVSLPLRSILASLAAAVGLTADTAPLGPPGEAIFWSVRLPRVLLAALVGGGLAVVGAALQAVFRNPMADSGLLGVGSGAALGAVLAVRFGLVGEVFFGLPLAASAGALAAMLSSTCSPTSPAARRCTGCS